MRSPRQCLLFRLNHTICSMVAGKKTELSNFANLYFMCINKMSLLQLRCKSNFIDYSIAYNDMQSSYR